MHNATAVTTKEVSLCIVASRQPAFRTAKNRGPVDPENSAHRLTWPVLLLLSQFAAATSALCLVRDHLSARVINARSTPSAPVGFHCAGRDRKGDELLPTQHTHNTESAVSERLPLRRYASHLARLLGDLTTVAGIPSGDSPSICQRDPSEQPQCERMGEVEMNRPQFHWCRRAQRRLSPTMLAPADKQCHPCSAVRADDPWREAAAHPDRRSVHAAPPASPAPSPAKSRPCSRP